jgi:2,4-dienoyl-CoA reductase-like NADH-dependent reductase (Old Yellow Enzyme family)/NAD(P)-dependent dehydrogenase (short-subunit alcohol dehydrogenase family)
MYKNLLSSGKIGQLELRNRIVMTPMGTNLSEASGHCGERIQAYYEARAQGGAGMLIVGVASIAWPSGACNPNQVAISSDEFLPGLCKLASRIKLHGCRAAVQLQHAGKVAVCDIAAGRPMLVPSIPDKSRDEMSAALTAAEMSAFVKSYSKRGAKVEYKVADHDDIRELIERFSEAAERARRAGFDGVELHAGHGYILSEFLSPSINRRDDEYGGCLENRARLLVDVIKAVKIKAGGDFPVWCRIDALEYRVDGGTCLADAVETAVLAEAAGADAIHVSAYANPSSGAAFTEAPLVHRSGGYLPFAATIKSRLRIPVIAVGRIEPDVAEQVLARGDADFIAMGRKLLADPQLPNKLMRGQQETIRPCIYCYTCVSRIFVSDHVHCAVNARTGYEHEIVLLPALQSRHVLVVGGGPAGMETARVAALRGHRVTLAEQSADLGGTVFFSSIVYPENGKLIDYLAAQVRQLGVDTRLSTTVDGGYLRALAPDVVVVATGARRDALPIPGAEQAHVFSGDQLRALMTGSDPAAVRDKLRGWQIALLSVAGLLGITKNAHWLRRLSYLWMPVGKRVSIVGGGLVGLELAEFLAERGRDVTVVEVGEKFGTELAIVRRWRVLEDLQQLGAVLINRTDVSCIKERSVTLVCDGDEVEIEADTVILASGATGDLSLAELSQRLGFETHVAGDCDGVGYIEGAIHSAHAVARSL